MSAVTEVTDATFAAEVLGSPAPVLVDYWAAWCSPCKQLSPIVDELAADYAGRLKVCKLDTDANPSTAQSQGIMSLPTLQLFVGGELVANVAGGRTKGALIKLVDEHV
jgi:thioredoxin 1